MADLVLFCSSEQGQTNQLDIYSQHLCYDVFTKQNLECNYVQLVCWPKNTRYLDSFDPTIPCFWLRKMLIQSSNEELAPQKAWFSSRQIHTAG